MGKEKTAETAIIQWLRDNGHYCTKVHSGSMFMSSGGKKYRVNLADKGTPDILSCVDGKFVAIEVKSGEEVVDEWARLQDRRLGGEDLPPSYHRQQAQIDTMQAIRDCGGIAVCCYDVESLKEELMKEALDDLPWREP